jgi:hypothetical protein
VSVLVLNGTAYVCQRGGHAQPRRAGQPQTSYAGRLTHPVRAELMVVPVVLVKLSPAQVFTIRALFANGNQVTCSGDVFNNAGASIVCSGEIVDDFHPAGPWFEVSLTLYEIGTALGYDADVPLVYLTNLPDDDTGAEKKAWTEFEVGFANLGTARLLNAVMVTECGTTPNPALNCAITYTADDDEEVSWLSTAFVSDGTLTGAPIVEVNSKGGTGDKWQTQNSRAVIELVRAGVVVFTITSDYAASNGDFAGAQITMPCADSTIVQGLIGDRVRVRIQARIGLHGGYEDSNDGSNLDRQTVTYGWGGSSYLSTLTWGGLARCLDPTP